jgi:hypothetical protein
MEGLSLSDKSKILLYGDRLRVMEKKLAQFIGVCSSAKTCEIDEKGIGKSVRPGNAGRRGVKRRDLHETSFVVQRVQNPPGQG